MSDRPEVYAKEAEEMRQKSDGELRQIRETGKDHEKRLADEMLQDRRYARNALPDRKRASRAFKVSIAALLISIFQPELRVLFLHLWEFLETMIMHH
jgi:hypothetical protein